MQGHGKGGRVEGGTAEREVKGGGGKWGQAPSRSPLQHSTLRIIKWTAKYFAAAVDSLKFCHVCKGAAAAGGVAVPIKRGVEEGKISLCLQSVCCTAQFDFERTKKRIKILKCCNIDRI